MAAFRKPAILQKFNDDGSVTFIKFKDWELALDWDLVFYEKIFNGERLVIDNKTVGVIVFGKEYYINW